MATKKTPDSPDQSSRTDLENINKTPGSTNTKPLARKKSASSATPRKPRSTARKLADAVTDRVKEISEKVTRKTTKTTPSATAAPKKTTTAAAPKTTRRTKIGALTPDTTSQQIREAVAVTSASETMPDEATIADEAATDVKQHYFHDQHPHHGPPPAHAPRELPDEYGDTKLVLLIRDPEWVYAYWEINDATRAALEIPRNGHQKRHVLRLYKITGRQWPDEPAHYFFDIDITPDARSWYLRLPEPNETWCAELAVIDGHDQYIPVCRSNSIATPRNTISDHIDSEWMTVEESFEKITRLSSANLEARLRGDTRTASESILRLIHKQLTGVMPGERMELSSGIFSSQAAVARKPKDFWLQVHTEVILYGATEPDAHVTVQGQGVTLNQDGTFSIRYALPDGQQILEVKAQNADGDREESITPIIQRTTT